MVAVSFQLLCACVSICAILLCSAASSWVVLLVTLSLTSLTCCRSARQYLCASKHSENRILKFFLAAVMNNSVCIYPNLGQNLFLENCSRIPLHLVYDWTNTKSK